MIAMQRSCSNCHACGKRIDTRLLTTLLNLHKSKMPRSKSGAFFMRAPLQAAIIQPTIRYASIRADVSAFNPAGTLPMGVISA
jgi:hypothetical protein